MNIPADHARFRQVGLHVQINDIDATIHLLDDKGQPSPDHYCRVTLKDGDTLAFYPIRSSAQRKVLRALGHGIEETSQP